MYTNKIYRSRQFVVIRSLWNSSYGLFYFLGFILALVGLIYLNTYLIDNKYFHCRDAEKKVMCYGSIFIMKNDTDKANILKREDCKDICPVSAVIALSFIELLMLSLFIFFLGLFVAGISYTYDDVKKAKETGGSVIKALLTTPIMFLFYIFLGIIIVTYTIIGIGTINSYFIKQGVFPCPARRKENGEYEKCEGDVGDGVILMLMQILVVLVIIFIIVLCNAIIGNARDELKKDLSKFDAEKQVEINKRMM